MSSLKSILFLLFLFIFSASCKEKWNEEDKRAFYTACTEEAKSNWAQTDSLAKKYCDCVFEKMAQKYPQEEDMLEHIDKLAKDTDLIKCRDEVQNQK